MHETLRELSTIQPLRAPVLIAGFADYLGTTAASAVACLIERWDAQPLADLDSEAFFDFAKRQPTARFVDGERAVVWPNNRFYVARPAGAACDVVLLTGTEPHLRWRAFCNAIASLMREVGASTSVTLGSYPGATPHSRPVPVRLSASDEALGRTFGIEPTTSTYEGPTGIVGVLNLNQRMLGFRNISLSTTTPFYVGVDPNPHAMLALVEAIDRALGSSTSLTELREQAAAVDRVGDQALERSEPLRTALRSLEQQFDAMRGTGMQFASGNTAASPLPSSGEVIADLEAFLRQQRDARRP